MKVNCYGIVPCRKVGESFEVFLIHQRKGHWGFPKGHSDDGENPVRTAERELFEETALKVTKWIITEPFIEHYAFTEGEVSYEKSVQYYLALVDGEPQFQVEEVQDGRWLTFPKAYNLLTFPNTKALLEKVADELHIPLG